MQHDCSFTNGDKRFRYRTEAIIIHERKMLFVKSPFGDHLYMIGGGVRMGETSVACIEREVFEESGLRAQVKRLSVVCENFF